MLRILERVKAEAGRSAENRERAEAGERGDQVVGQPLAPMPILEDPLKGQDGETEASAGLRVLVRLAQPDPRDLYGLSDALQRLRADPFDAKIRPGSRASRTLSERQTPPG